MRKRNLIHLRTELLEYPNFTALILKAFIASGIHILSVSFHHNLFLYREALIIIRDIFYHFLFQMTHISTEGISNLLFHIIKRVPSPTLMRRLTCCGSSFMTPVLPSRMRLFLIAVSFLFSFDGECDVISSFSLGISTIGQWFVKVSRLKIKT